MAETTSTAADNPTPRRPLAQMQTEPTRHDGSQPQGVISDAAYDQLPTDSDRERFSRVRKDPDGGSEWRERATLQSETTPASTASGDSAKPVATVTEDGRLRVGELLLSDQDITGLMERHALEKSRKSTMPTTAADYTLDLPSDFQMPEGVSWKWATDHAVTGPLIGQAKELAHSLGMDQTAFSKMMSLFVASQVHEAQLIAKAQSAEREKLWPNIAHRVDAVQQFIRGTVGDDRVAKALTQQMLTADAVVGWEKVIRKATSQGAAPFSQAHRDPGSQQGRVSEAEYAAMTSAERWNYARQFDQKQFRS